MIGRMLHDRKDRRPVGPEALEPRRLMSVDLAEGVLEADDRPQVEAVYANGTGWSADFRAALEEQHAGSALLGAETRIAEIRGNSGPGDLNSRILPWVGVNQVSFQFSEDVSVQQDDLLIDGTRQEYAVTAFSYDAETFVATWTLDRAIGADVVVLRLDGDSATGVTDLEGNPLNGNCTDDGGEGGSGDEGRDLCSGLVVLPGDTNRDGRVNATDIADVKRRLGTSATGPRLTGAPYSVFTDVTGDGRINASDLAAVKGRLTNTLPDVDDDGM